ncbi:hypothetical protein AB0B31_11045 [Catellatospora citrea]|uniref:hypothetical protein n=1 Tax=Catellatospora citrea TaxID=53366 RepID=UPI0033C44D1C
MTLAIELGTAQHVVLVAVPADQAPLTQAAMRALAPYALLSQTRLCDRHLFADRSAANPARVRTSAALPADMLDTAGCVARLAPDAVADTTRWLQTVAGTSAARTLRDLTPDLDHTDPHTLRQALDTFVGQPRIGRLLDAADDLVPEDFGAALEAHQRNDRRAYAHWLGHNTLLGQALLDHHGLLTPRPQPIGTLLYSLDELHTYWHAAIARISALPEHTMIVAVHAALQHQPPVVPVPVAGHDNR